MRFNHKQAYTLGFLFADGHVNKVNCISVNCKTVDINKIQDTLYSLLDWRVFKSQRDRYGVVSKPQTMLYKGNKEFGLYLKSNGYSTNRDGTLALSIIPKKHQYMWFRGYLDGDGCLYYHKKQYLKQLTFAGPNTLDWSFITNRFSGFTVTKNLMYCRATRIDHITKFMDYIYPNGYDNIGLYRKYAKYELML